MELGLTATRRRTHTCLGTVLTASIALAWAPLPGLAQTFSTARTLTVTGSVLDAVSGQAVGHALVRLGQRAVLSDSEGHFSFPRVDPSITSASAMKPGYSFTQTPGDATEISIPPESLGDPLILRLYPEALLVGTVTDEDGAPLRNVAVTALRSSNQDDGHHWIVSGLAHSNARGQFRLGVPAGDYRVESEYLKPSPRRALLPSGAPESPGEHPLHVRSREQASADLHPATARLVDVIARVDGEAAKELSQLNAISNNGRRFPVEFTPSSNTDIQMSLPIGDYTLEVKHHSFAGDGSDLASIRVTQPESSTLPVALHFTPVAPVPVELRVDEASLTAANYGSGRAQNMPTAASFGLTLETLTGTDTEPLRPTQRLNDASFVAPAGAYRLRARPGGAWYVTSASAGGNDLLTHELLVAAGAGSTPIQIVVSNQTASLKGTVTTSGKPVQAWVYLLAAYPSASPLYTLHSGVDGIYNNSSLPPGTYNAIAFAQRYVFDPYDPDALSNYASHLTPVTMQAGEKAKLDLEMVTDAEMKP